MLPNGLTFHRFSGGDQPVCRLRILFCGGQAETGNKLISKVMLSALAEGTHTIPTETFADLLDYNGVRIGSDSHSHYSSLTIAMLNHRAASVTPLIASMLAGPLFPKSASTPCSAMSEAQLEIADTEVSSSLAGYTSDALTMGKNHPLAQRLTHDRHRRNHTRRHHISAPAHDSSGKDHAYLSGLLDETTIDAVRTLLSGIKATGRVGIKMVPNEPEPRASRRIRRRHPAGAIAATLPAVSRSHPDYNDLRLAVVALGGYFGNRLMSNIREESMTYGISAYLQRCPRRQLYNTLQPPATSSTPTMFSEKSHWRPARLADRTACGCVDELSRLKRHARPLAQTLDSHLHIGLLHTSLLVGTPPDLFRRTAASHQTLSTAGTCILLPQNELLSDRTKLAHCS